MFIGHGQLPSKLIVLERRERAEQKRLDYLLSRGVDLQPDDAWRVL